MIAYTEFFAQLVGAEIELWARLDDLLIAETGVSVARLQALQAIAGRGGAARVQDVSEQLQITVGAASKLVDRLHRDGLAVRSVHPSDRRSMVIALTPVGELAHDRARAAADLALDRLLGDHLDEAAAAGLARTLSSVRTALREKAIS